MRTCEWQGTLPVSSRKEIFDRSLFMLQTEDEAYIAFSHDRSCTKPYDLVAEVSEAHRFATFEKAFGVHLELIKRHGERTTIVSI